MRTLARTLAIALVCVIGAGPALASGGEGASGGGRSDKPKGPAQRSSTTLKSWVNVDPFTVTIIQDGRVRGTLTVNFGMDVPDDALRETAWEMMPRLRDGWLRSLSLLASTSLRPHRQVDVVALSNRLQAVADEVLKKPGSKVLMAQAVVNMPN